ncbi:MAG: hypothetical protein P8Y63_05565 [Deltaproteobacteria bacterium]|jgi:uncharacterized membrane protein
MNFIKTTLIGGFLFLIPFSIVLLILGKVRNVMEKMTAPLANWLPVETVGGFAKANLVAVIAIILACFVAGLLSKSRLAARVVESLESDFLQFFPGYTFIKGLTGGWAGDKEKEQLTPVLAKFDDYWQLAFRVERLADGRLVLFLPGTPDPWSGSLVIVDEERVQPIGQSMAATVRNLRALGRGTDGLLSTGSMDAKEYPTPGA